MSHLQRRISHNRLCGFRAGFTLVELLVAIIIFLILASLAFGAFRAATDGERGPAAASSFRAWVEGARSRAADLGRPVGIRPIIDAANLSGHIANEFEYVASIEPLQGSLVPGRSGFLPPFDPATPNVTGYPQVGYRVAAGLQWVPAVGKWAVTQDPADVPPWSLLDGMDDMGNPDPNEQQLIVPGQRIGIRFGQDDVLWFSISAADSRTNTGLFNPSADHDSSTAGVQANTFFVEGSIPGAVWMQDLSTAVPNQSMYVVPQQQGPSPGALASIPISYQIELGVDYLEGERVLRLPAGMYVDFDASSVPATARPGSATGAYGTFSLMFSPTGEVVGDYVGAGAVTFFMDSRDALELYAGSGVDLPETSWNEATHVRSAWTTPIPSNLVIPVESPGDPQLLTVFPKTGFVQTTPIDPTDTDADGWADNPYSFRFVGSLDR